MAALDPALALRLSRNVLGTLTGGEHGHVYTVVFLKVAMYTLRSSRPEDGPALVDLWRRSVDATHHFLSAEDRQAIDAEVSGFLPHAPMIVAVDEKDYPHGFMLIDGTHMEALFIDPDVRGKGIGRQLLQHGVSLHRTLTTDVNMQNSQAVGFYQRMGFVETGRSETDSQGRPYPLIHLRYPG